MLQNAERAEGIMIFSHSTASLPAIQKGDSVLVLNIHIALHKILRFNKKCIIKCIPADVGINENETADALAKEARKVNNDKLPFVVTLNDINSVTRSTFTDKTLKFKYQTSELLITNVTLANTFTRLRARHLRAIKYTKME
ncbi:hypothetical protein TNCT_492021 [Trichonephila clavata]|uniref:Uncharacterized protein n=1 Tax=Trichonephila clavata TaxID=2740835 RepID=A0A8X6HFU1_TRICU|nr:hypothetical protein TNCT_492021 [Trichonephila clavata]